MKHEAIMRNTPDGRYELYCYECNTSVIPELPISMSDMVRLVEDFEHAHSHIEYCTWRYDDYDESWESKCGLAWRVFDGSPRDNEMSYCPKCGRHLILMASEEEE